MDELTNLINRSSWALIDGLLVYKKLSGKWHVAGGRTSYQMTRENIQEARKNGARIEFYDRNGHCIRVLLKWGLFDELKGKRNQRKAGFKNV